MPNDMINISVAELNRLKERTRKLALDKSYQQLVMQLMSKMSETSGLENVIDHMLHSIVDVIGGANISLYYKIDEAIFYADVYGFKKPLQQLNDESVETAFITGNPCEYEHDFSDTHMLTPAFTHAYTWVYPLKVDKIVIGVFKMEGLHIPMSNWNEQLPIFFNYAALILKNEILGYTRLQQINNLLQQEIITRKQTEQELLIAKNAAESANKAKSSFLANMSHELRTPMNVVLGFSQLMQKDTNLTSVQHNYLTIINNSGRHLLTLINNVLDIAKIEAGRMTIENSSFDLGSLIRDTIDMMRERAQIKELELRLDSSSKFPRFISSDESKLRQILLNLIGNAIKYTKTGRITLSLDAQDLPNTQQCLLNCAIKDTGVGIAEHDLPFVFDTFVQVGNISEQQGSGLGLPITQQYAQLMGGNVSVSSEIDKGSIFTLTLPVTHVDQSEVVKKEHLNGRQVRGLAAGQPHYRILIVEDSLENRLLLKILLESVGFTVIEAVNGRQGIEQFMRWQPQFIWMDNRMPIMDGIEATRRIRTLNNGKDVKIVAVTASAFLQERQEFLDAGVDDVIHKPYREAEIFACMVQQLGVHFIYEKPLSEPIALVEPLSSEKIKQLPEQLLSALQDATMSVDIEQSMAVIELIRAIDSALADTLQQHVEQFDFAAITKLF
jgi:signal transduction histidine kinase/DNA-binding NarL/FixJ family response regulator